MARDHDRCAPKAKVDLPLLPSGSRWSEPHFSFRGRTRTAPIKHAIASAVLVQLRERSSAAPVINKNAPAPMRAIIATILVVFDMHSSQSSPNHTTQQVSIRASRSSVVWRGGHGEPFSNFLSMLGSVTGAHPSSFG